MKTIIEPFRIKSVEPLRQTSAEERARLLAEAGDAAALLIHHQHGVARQDPPQGSDQGAKLRGIVDVAREQDRARRGVGAEQGRFVRQQDGAGDADDGGLHGGSIARHTPESLPPGKPGVACRPARRTFCQRLPRPRI